MLTAAHHEPGKSRRTDIRLLRPCAPALREKAAGTDFAHWSTGVNPIGRWAEKHFEEPSVTVVLPFGYAVLVHEPRAIRRVLLENTVNYPKGFAATPGFLSAGLNDRLLSAEGARWQVQRRALAPMFTPRTTMSFAPYLPVGFVQVNAMRLTLRLSALRRRTANVQRLGPCVARGGPRAGDHREKVPTGPRIRMRRLAFAEGNAAAGAWASYDRQSQVSGTARRSVCVGPKRPREL